MQSSKKSRPGKADPRWRTDPKVFYRVVMAAAREAVREVTGGSKPSARPIKRRRRVKASPRRKAIA